MICGRRGNPPSKLVSSFFNRRRLRYNEGRTVITFLGGQNE
ncbi:hypothetical protein SD77_1075 [Bacillus badius]|uniref:Ribose 5-phosphate isomerase B n=1 Tax=Bacillus badius TaxID=1455 RepID=A0ABR5ATT0_BACBA|nr:hypothetical protein SD77_1075 [Bacillus badius]